MHHFSNKEISHTLSEMAALYEMKEVAFKPQAYERAARGVASHKKDLFHVYERTGTEGLTKIPGVGKSIAEHIAELFETGYFSEYEELKSEIPVDVEELTAVEGVGPQTVHTLWQELGVRTLDDLEKAVQEHKVQELEGFGEKSEEKIRTGIAFLRSAEGRFTLGAITAEVRDIEQAMAQVLEVDRVTVAGSYRRRKETVGDIDLLVTSREPEAVMEHFIAFPHIGHVYGTGETKTNVRLKSGIDLDLRVVPEESWGAALNYFTGSKAHNVALRTIAQENGWKLNEYGLFDGEEMIAGETEEELYAALGLSYIPPELRENTGEIEAAREGALPELIDYGDLKGDLQIQTNWTDGADSIEEMARAAADEGLSYICITDHTQGLAMTGGADEAQLREQMEAIDHVNATLDREGVEVAVLKGAEVNIQKDGTPDIADEVLAELDMVGAAVHTYFDLPEEEQTQRMIRAMEHPHVDMIFHLSGRLINRRKPIALDMERIFDAAERTGVVLEINAYPDRLDISDKEIRECADRGIPMCINTDAHAAEHLALREFGIAQARRGWARRTDVINTFPRAECLDRLK